ncbi:MAG: FGGY-family carbohydrate kinase [Bacteroidota bacterium]
MDLIVGVDLGTTHLKAGAFTVRGEQTALALEPTPVRHLPDGGGEHEAEELWSGVARCLARIAAQVKGRIAGIGVASMAEAGVLLDADDRPLGPVIAWYDPRTRPQAAALARLPGREYLFRRTGLFVHPKHGLCKLLWLKEERPAIFARGASWLNLAEYAAFRMTGCKASCPTLAARTLAYDLVSGRWAGDLLRELEVPAELFPSILPEGRLLGTLRGEAAAAAGLPADIPVALAGHDHPCACLSAAAAEPGVLLDSAGTSEALLGAIPAPALTDKACAAQISQGPLPLPDLYGLQTGSPAGGGSLDWLRRTFFPGRSFAELEEEATTAGESPTGLLFLPHLAGSGPPAADPEARGALVGLTYGADRGRVIKAILEGACYELRLMVETMESVTGRPFHRLVAVGGQARSRLWMQLKADILGRTFAVPEEGEATLLGAALLGGVAGGVFPDVRAAAAAPVRKESAVVPRPGSGARYEGYYRSYRRLRAVLRPLFHAWPADEAGGPPF